MDSRVAVVVGDLVTESLNCLPVITGDESDLPKSCCFKALSLFSSKVTVAMLAIEPSTHKASLSSTQIL